MRRLFAVLAAALTFGALAAPAAYADDTPELVITASVDDAPQLVGKPFPITVTLTNRTDQPMTKVTIWAEHLSGSYLTVDDWAGIGVFDQGVTLDPGVTRSFTLTAAVWSWNLGAPQTEFRGFGSVQSAVLTVPFVDPTTTTGSATGVVYGDRNDNQTYDDGEGLAGAAVTLFGTGDFHQVTGPDGRFTFSGIPAQRYSLSVGNLPDGWVLAATGTQYVDIGGGEPTTEPKLRAIRPLSEQLHVTGSFDRHDYQPGDSVQVTFTLTNVGDKPMADISIGCDRAGGSEQHLLGWESWSDIAYPAKVTLAAGESRTFVETGTVPAASTKYGGFYAGCDFGPESGPLDGRPELLVYGRVPAPPGATGGTVFHDDDGDYTVDPGEAIGNTAVTLVDAIDGTETATAETDANGHVSFASVPAGFYVLRVANGWRPIDHHGDEIAVGTCWSCDGGWTLRFKH